MGKGRRRVILLIGVVLFALACGEAAASLRVIKFPPEPKQEDLLRATEVNGQDAKALAGALSRLVRHFPDQTDADLPRRKQAEEAWLEDERAARKAVVFDGEFFRENAELMKKLDEELTSKRLNDPGRQMDAIARRLEEVGTAAELYWLMWAARTAKTQSGAWRFLSSIQGILSRIDAAELMKTPDLSDEDLIPLLRDLPAKKAGTLALAYWKKYRKHDLFPEPLMRVWLAWNIGEADPALALEILSASMGSRDPGLRLFAGMAILRIGASPPASFKFTAPPSETEAERSKWLETCKPERPEEFYFPDPLSMPLIINARGPRKDLWWVNQDGERTRETQDVWPFVGQISPDGTYYFFRSNPEPGVVGPDGRVLVRFSGIRDWCTWWPAQHGGIWGGAQPAGGKRAAPACELLGELDACGTMIWATHREGRAPFYGGRGKVLLVHGGGFEILNRRGDTVWSETKDFHDARWACMIDAESVLVCCTNEIQVRKKGAGILRKVGTFKSLGWVRYHPARPWIIFDAGSQEYIIYDAVADKRVTIKGYLPDDGKTYKSKWRIKNFVPE